MGYFDDVINRTKSVAEVVGKKSAEAIEISKKKIELVDCNNKLNKAYAVLGKFQYENIRGIVASESQVQFAVDEIEKHYNRAKSLEEEIKNYQAVRKCQNCGAEISRDGVFCSHCGATITY